MAIYPTLIADNALDLKPAPPEFVKSFADTVGKSGTPQDGFDLLLRPADLHLADAGNFLAGLDIGLHDLGLSQTEIATPFHADFEQHLTATIRSGQPDFDAYAVHLTGKNPPATGAGSGPGVNTGGLQQVNFGTLQAGAASEFVTVTVTNTLNSVVHPTSIKVEQGKLQVFVATSECGASIPAGGKCNIVVECRPLLAGHYTGLLVFNTDAPNSPNAIALSVTVTPRAVGGVGGGGVGPGAANDPFGLDGVGTGRITVDILR